MCTFLPVLLCFSLAFSLYEQFPFKSHPILALP